MAKGTKQAAVAEGEEPTDDSPVDSVQAGPEDTAVGEGDDLNPLDSLDMGFRLEPEAQAALDFDPFAGNMEGDPEPEVLKEGSNDELEVKNKNEDEQAAGDSEEQVAAAAAASGTEKPSPESLPGEQEKPAASPAASDPRDQQIATLMQTVTSLTEQVGNMSKPAEAAAAATTQEESNARFFKEIPEPMMNLINSEDLGERKQGVAALVQGVGIMVHEVVMKDVETRLSAVQTETAQTVSQNSKLQETYLDFYKTFPTLDNDALRPMVAAESQAVFAELGIKEWSPAVRDAIGTRVLNKLKEFAPSAPVVGSGGNGNGGEKPPQETAPAKLKGGGSRPASTAGSSSESEIEDVIFGPGR